MFGSMDGFMLCCHDIATFQSANEPANGLWKAKIPDRKRAIEDSGYIGEPVRIF
jgi:hypothetical protein